MWRLRPIVAALPAIGLLASAGGAPLQPASGFEVFAGASLAYDDNILRLPDGVDPATVVGGASRGDTIRTLRYGLSLDLQAGLQRFEAAAARIDTHHDHYTVLDLDGHDARAIWHWQVGERNFGQLGATDVRTLAAFGTPLPGGGTSIVPNVLDTRRWFVDAAHAITARWQVRVERDQFDQENSAVTRRSSDITADGATVTLSYTTPPGNRVGVAWRGIRGDLPNPLDIGGLLVDNSYRQNSAAAFVDWSPSAISNVKLRLGHDQRRYEQLPQRDYEGPAYRLSLGWRPSELLTFDLVARREISPDEEVQVGLVRVRGVAMQAQWRPSEMIRVDAYVERGRRDYLGDPFVALGVAPPRIEQVWGGALALTYQPLPSVTLSASWRGERRYIESEATNQRYNLLALAAGFTY